MMPDKLTDKEIVKALRSWLEEIRKSRQAYLEKVNEEHYPSMRYEYLLSDTIHEINRLQAEINRKELVFIETLRRCALKDEIISEKTAEIEKLQAENERLSKITRPLIAEIKAEAYKEFAELLHCQCESIINQPHNENVRPISWKVAYEEFDEKVDNLLKEKVGDDNVD